LSNLCAPIGALNRFETYHNFRRVSLIRADSFNTPESAFSRDKIVGLRSCGVKSIRLTSRMESTNWPQQTKPACRHFCARDLAISHNLLLSSIKALEASLIFSIRTTNLDGWVKQEAV